MSKAQLFEDVKARCAAMGIECPFVEYELPNPYEMIMWLEDNMLFGKWKDDAEDATPIPDNELADTMTKMTAADMTTRNAYRILGKRHEAKKRYRRLAIKFHPDKGGNPHLFLVLTAARRVMIRGR